ncbi:MAG TPA: HRDC domain-containing protein [Candidatus Hydrogenedentes bacterium]|nr:HRDC domain-containing protein [Candidatus Hydrogenedentota bacterium]
MAREGVWWGLVRPEITGFDVKSTELSPLSNHHYVDTQSELESLARRLRGAPRVSIDTEADSLHHYRAKVCLVQLTIEGEDFIVDPLVGLDLAPLLDVLAKQTLVAHAGDYDLRMMRQSFGFRPRGRVFDTMLAAQLLGHEELSLVAVVGRYLGVTLSKKGQKSDWAQRPLTDAQKAYACADTHYLEPLACHLEQSLGVKGRLEWHRESCERMVASTAAEAVRDPEWAWRIRGSGALTSRQQAFLRALWTWREREAERTDRPSFKIMPNQWIIDLAVWAEGHPGAALSGGPPLPRNCTGQRLAALREALDEARCLPKSQWPGRPPRTNAHRPCPCEERLKALQEACERVANEIGLAPSMVAPRANLAAIACSPLQSRHDIMALGSLMHWQAALLEAAIL